MNHQVRTLIEQQYDIGNIQQSEPILEGVLSHNARIVTDAGIYFLKQYRSETALGKTVAAIHAVKAAFAARGLPVILPLPTRTGATLVTLGELTLALFPFLTGVRKARRGALTASQAHAMGDMLGTMHRVGQELRVDGIPIAQPHWDLSRTRERIHSLLRHIESLPTQAEFDTTAAIFLRKKDELLQQTRESYEAFNLQSDCLTHSDYHDQNLFFNEEDTIVAIFDWERTRYAPRASELVRAVDLSCFTSSYMSSTELELAQAMIRAYHQSLPLDVQEFTRAIRAYYIAERFSTWIEEAHYLAGDTRADVFLPRERTSLEFHATHLDERTELLTSFL